MRSNLGHYQISKSTWDRSDESSKHSIGLKHATFSVNADKIRKELAFKFLNNVGGLDYLPEDQRSIEINERLDNLYNAHHEPNNFYNEEPHVKSLKKLVPDSGIIPRTIRNKYVKVIFICRLGNNYGISFTALPSYSQMIDMFRDEEIVEFLELLNDTEIITKLNNKDKYNIFIQYAEFFEKKTKDEIIIQALSVLKESSKNDITNRKTYREISKIIKSNRI